MSESAFDPYLDWLKIPAERRPPTAWDLLGLEQGPIELEVLHKAAADRLELVRRYANSPQPEVSEAALRIQGELSRALMELERLATPAEKPAADDEQPAASSPPDAKRASGRAPSLPPRGNPAEAGSPRPADAAVLRPAPLPDVPRFETRPAPSSATEPADAQGTAGAAPGKRLPGRILVLGAILGVAALLIAALVHMNAQHQKALAVIEATAQARRAAEQAQLAAAQKARQEAERKKSEEEAARKAAELAARQEAERKKAAALATAQAAAGKKAEEEAARKRLPREIAVDLGREVRLELVLIPAGSFMMGDNEGEWNEKPAHRVNITKPFYFGKYEVTQGEYEQVMGKNPSWFSTGGFGKDTVRGKDTSRFPVERVSWEEEAEFCRRLSQQEGRTYRLPTEAEWEYACRAGTTTRYCFGDAEAQLGEYAWYAENSRHEIHPVGQNRPNAFGLYDMHGNVWEWCADWYDSSYHSGSPRDDPTGPSGDSNRVLRGGSRGNDAKECSAAARGGGSETGAGESTWASVWPTFRR